MNPVGPEYAGARSEPAVGSHATAAVGSEGPSIGDLFGKLGNELGTLVQKEVALLKVEMTLKAKAVLRNVVMIAIGAGFSLVSLLVLTAALVLGLATMMEPWLAALVVGGVFALVAAVTVFKGIAGLRRIEAKPEQTIETLRENKQWAQELVR